MVIELYPILFILLFSLYNSYLILPFEREYSDKSLTKENIYKELSENIITSKIFIGTPRQSMKMQIISRNFYCYVLNDEIKNGDDYLLFKTNSSSSYERSEYFYSFDIRDFKSAESANDYMTIGNINVEDVKKKPNFLSAYSIDKEKITLKKGFSGRIGLDASKGIFPFSSSYNLISFLKSYDLIKKYCFYLNYTKNSYNGNLIIGNYPFEIDNKTYKEDNFTKTKILTKDNMVTWGFIADAITIKDSYEDNNSSNIYFDFENEMFISNEMMKETLTEKFFNKNKCEEKIIDDISYFKCNENVNIKDFKTIYFNNIESNRTFELTANDLFYKYDNEYYFLIKFDNNLNNTDWTFGQIFLRKYLTIFNQDEKLIYFYSTQIKEEDNPSKNNHIGAIIILSLVCVALVGIIIFGVYYIMSNKKRKIRANEMSDDNYEYSLANK